MRYAFVLKIKKESFLFNIYEYQCKTFEFTHLLKIAILTLLQRQCGTVKTVLK